MLTTACFPDLSHWEQLIWTPHGKGLDPRRALYVEVDVHDTHMNSDDTKICEEICFGGIEGVIVYV
jgi:hypothetical protein